MSTIRQLQFIKKGVLEWREVETPVIDGENQALVRPVAVARCDLDLPVFRGQTLFRAVRLLRSSGATRLKYRF